MIGRVVALALSAATVGGVQTDRPLYSVIATIPDRAEGQQFRTFDTDWEANRVYMGSDRGLYWVDLAEPDRVKGPMFEKDIVKIEFAQNLGRLFYFTKDEVGYADVRVSPEPMRMRSKIEARAMAYEPSLRQLYVATRDPYLHVFDARSGEFGSRLQIEGWFATSLEGAPGRVYMQTSGKQGIFAIDAQTKRVSPWRVEGITTPAYMEADQAGEYLFLTWDRYLAVVDAKTGKRLDRIVTWYGSAMAFDPGSRLVVVTWDDGQPPIKLTIYRVEPAGFVVAGKLENPRIGLSGVVPTNRGFLQRGVTNLLVWAFQGK